MPRARRTDITSDDKQQLGIEYQYLYFILQLLEMKPGDTVGYEALDDVHIVSSSHNYTTYIQIKHTINTASDGSHANMPKLSSEFWKSLANWAMLIRDPVENRGNVKSQLAFLKQSRFLLAANRNSSQNEIVQQISLAKTKKISGKDWKESLEAISKATKDETIKGYIQKLSSLSNKVLSLLFEHTEIIETDNLYDKILEAIRGKMVLESYVEDIFNTLYSELKKDFFSKVKHGEHQVISYDDWIQHYTAIFQEYRSTLLPFRNYSPVLPEHLEEQAFVKELIEIGEIDLSSDGLAEIAELTQMYLTIELQLDDWYEDGRISNDQRTKFHQDAALLWTRIHKKCHRTTATDASLDFVNAIACFDSIMSQQLRLLSTEIGLGLSNGEFIKLANEREIGWKYHWKEG